MIKRWKQKINQKRYRVKNSSSYILAKHFFDIIETGDLRYLLVLKNYKKFPEYNQENLLDAWDKIILEHENDTGNKSFSNNLISVNYGLKERNRILGLRACYYILTINPDKVFENIKKLGFNIKDSSINELRRLDSYIKSLETKLRIKSLKDSKKKFKNPYFDIVYILKTELPGFNDKDMSLKEMDSLMRNIEVRNSKLKEKYGRTN